MEGTCMQAKQRKAQIKHLLCRAAKLATVEQIVQTISIQNLHLSFGLSPNHMFLICSARARFGN